MKTKSKRKSVSGRPPKRKSTAKRPLRFKTVKSLRESVEAYFNQCGQGKNQKPYTISGLALALGMSRSGLLKYEGWAGYGEVIRTAKARCEAYAEERLLTGRGVAGVMFSLKNNFENWRDKATTELLKGPMEVILVDAEEDAG